MMIYKQKAYGSDCRPNWCLELDGYERIVEVIISCGDVVNRIAFVIADAFGTTTTVGYGSRSGSTSRIKLKSNEYITNISGTHGVNSYCGDRVITSLKIHTNFSPSGYEFHGEANFCTDVHDFSTHVRRGLIAGFHGRHGHHLESIGIYLRKPTI